MKANRKYIEGEEAVSAVIGVILMVAITVAIAATVYVYVSGLATSPTSDAENASVAVKNENGKIKIKIVDDTGMIEFSDMNEEIDSLLSKFLEWENMKYKKS